MRIKSGWFKQGKTRTPEDIASALAFISWRLSLNTLKNVRRSQFDVEVGLSYFSFLSEVLIFLIQISDRIAYRVFSPEERNRFTQTVARHVSDTLSSNQNDLLGLDQTQARSKFIAMLNQRAEGYAEHPYDPDDMNFGLARYLGSLIEPILEPKDRLWILDQIISIEAPEAISTLERAMSRMMDPSEKSTSHSSLTEPE